MSEDKPRRRRARIDEYFAPLSGSFLFLKDAQENTEQIESITASKDYGLARIRRPDQARVWLLYEEPPPRLPPGCELLWSTTVDLLEARYLANRGVEFFAHDPEEETP